jgi:hypothetical protein
MRDEFSLLTPMGQYLRDLTIGEKGKGRKAAPGSQTLTGILTRRSGCILRQAQPYGCFSNATDLSAWRLTMSVFRSPDGVVRYTLWPATRTPTSAPLTRLAGK